MAVQNIAVKLCGVLQSQGDGEVTACEWRLLGQEQDGSQLLSWVSTRNAKEVLNVGAYTNKTKTLATLHVFEERLNIIQASVNATHSLLVYVVKDLPNDDDKEPVYRPYLVCLLPDKDKTPIEVEEGSTKQIMLQYVYGKSNKYSPGIRNDRFLLFKHLEYIKIYRTPMFLNECDDGSDQWGFDGIYTDPETIVNVFSWAQWDCVNQVLYYIHYREGARSFAEGEEVKSPIEVTPTLSALQFHADLPHETVLNIPLSLPHLHAGGGAAAGAACGAYEDDPIPLRVHDCSLDLQIVCDQRGVLCICHHYLYKPLDDSTSSLVLEDTDMKDSGVNFAYSITLLQHGVVVHSVVPDLPWALAKSLRPSYTLYADNHLLVNIPMLYTHLLDISLYHEPCCHVVLPADDCDTSPSLAPILGWGPHSMVDLNTLDVVTMNVLKKDLTATFKSDTALENKLAIMHYLILHEGDTDLAEELISWQCVNQGGANGGGGGGGSVLQSVMQEYLIAGTFGVTRRSLPASAAHLMAMLPYTLHSKLGDVKVRDMCVSVSSEKLWNSAAVVLGVRQRVCQFAEDVWTRLWTALNTPAPPRLSPAPLRDKLRVSLHCYQPEALSRCSTPMSPTGGGGLPGAAGAGGGAGGTNRRSSIGAGTDVLPFLEVDVCTASKQEHIIAANLREVSVHLMRESAGAGARVESGVHALATRWAAAQLDASRALCRAACRALAATLPAAHAHHRGFAFIAHTAKHGFYGKSVKRQASKKLLQCRDEMDETHAFILFKVLEQYYLAADSIAFPLPQGFSSFFTYLGYRALPFAAFLQRVHRNVLELQIDVVKQIVTAKDDDNKSTVNHKLRLIQLAGEGRARRALAAWPHRAALLLRARDHAAALLSGGAQGHRDHSRHRPGRDTGIAALPPGSRLSPLDTFLDLLTAKASLNELDFNLIIEATLASVQQHSAL